MRSALNTWASALSRASSEASKAASIRRGSLRQKRRSSPVLTLRALAAFQTEPLALASSSAIRSGSMSLGFMVLRPSVEFFAAFGDEGASERGFERAALYRAAGEFLADAFDVFIAVPAEAVAQSAGQAAIVETQLLAFAAAVGAEEVGP